MTWLAAFLLIVSVVFGAAATDQLAKPEYLPPEQDRVDRLMRCVLGVCALIAALAAGLLL